MSELRKAREKARVAAVRARELASKRLEAEKGRAAHRLRQHQLATQKLREKIGDLERRLKHGETAQSEGLLQEKVLIGFLKEHFRADSFVHVGKGGDVLHEVRTTRGALAGRIVYEVKRVSAWSSSHVRQCAEARITREADLAILVTNRFPAKRQYYFVERGVLVISPVALVPLVHTAREGLLSAHALRASGDEKSAAVNAIHDYLAAGPYMAHIRRVAQHLADLEDLVQKEIHTHHRVWDSRLSHYAGIVAGISAVHDRLHHLLAPVSTRQMPQVVARALFPQFTKKPKRHVA